jgi:hypothetical protein
MEKLCFLRGPCRDVTNKGQSQLRVGRRVRGFTRVEVGPNTSTVTLRVVGGDEKGSLKSETIKYGCKSQGTRTEKDCAGKG